MQVHILVPRSVVQDAKAAGIWLEEVPDLRQEVAGEPDHFWEQAQTIVEFIGYGADTVTVIVSAKEISKLLSRAISLLRGQSEDRAALSIKARGLKASIELDLDKVDEKTIDKLAEVIQDLNH
jgi:hypothetical protein